MSQRQRYTSEDHYRSSGHRSQRSSENHSRSSGHRSQRSSDGRNRTGRTTASSGRHKTSDTGENTRRRKRKKHPIRRFLLLLLLLVVVLIVGAGVYIVSSLSEIENHELQNVALCGDNDPNIGKYTTIALFGVDSRANDLRKNTRSDSIMIASINKKTHEVKLVSVFRDTYVQIEDHGCSKANHAYAYGGPDLAVDTLNKNFDLSIQDFVTVNFSALTNVIDELGGITLNIKKEELKWVNAYGRDVARINGQKYTKIKKPGKQTVTGVQATGYCRVRYTKGGDFTRAERQRTVLQAIFDKAKTTTPTTLVSVMDTIFPQIYTSLSTQDMLALLMYLPFYDIGEQQGFPYKQNGHKGSDGVYYGFPDTLESNVIKLHEELFGTKDYSPSDTVRKISKKTSG
ncbi:MAG: LCP family protein [Lachnospiraceae bacterium]|nr:LCP family protein [Lachnospiraceae bacterium]